MDRLSPFPRPPLLQSAVCSLRWPGIDWERAGVLKPRVGKDWRERSSMGTGGSKEVNFFLFLLGSWAGVILRAERLSSKWGSTVWFPFFFLLLLSSYKHEKGCCLAVFEKQQPPQTMDESVTGLLAGSWGFCDAQSTGWMHIPQTGT